MASDNLCIIVEWLGRKVDEPLFVNEYASVQMFFKEL